MEQVKLRQGLQIEDKQFQTMINDSGVSFALQWNMHSSLISLTDFARSRSYEVELRTDHGAH